MSGHALLFPFAEYWAFYVSLGIIVSVIAASITLSLLFPRAQEEPR